MPLGEWVQLQPDHQAFGLRVAVPFGSTQDAISSAMGYRAFEIGKGKLPLVLNLGTKQHVDTTQLGKPIKSVAAEVASNGILRSIRPPIASTALPQAFSYVQSTRRELTDSESLLALVKTLLDIT